MSWKKVSYIVKESGYSLPDGLSFSDQRALLRATEAHKDWLKHQAYTDIYEREVGRAVSELPEHLLADYVRITDDLSERHGQFSEALASSKKATIPSLRAIYNKLMSVKVSPYKDLLINA